MLGGSISNLVDRLRLGYVTDFLDFDYWPAFNLADTFIVVGVGVLFLSFVAADRSSPLLARRRSRVSESDAGRRLDAVVAELPAVGTRALAERLVGGGAVLVDGRARPKSHRLSGGEELDVDVPEPTGARAGRPRPRHGLRRRAPARRRQARRARRAPFRTGGADDPRARPARARRGGRGPRPAGDRPPARSRHVGLLVVARSDAAHARLTEAIAERRSSGATSPSSGRAALAHRADHGADRPRPARPHAPLARHATPRGGRHVVRGARAARRARPPRGAARDGAGRTRSASTSRRSSSPSAATPCTASPATSVSRGSSSTRTGSRSSTRSRVTGSSWRRRSPPDLAAALERARGPA